MVDKLDNKSLKMQSVYKQCYKQNCLNLKPTEQGGNALEINQKEVFVKSDDSTITEYNQCVESCQQDLRDFRFQTEFQMREF